ncbi:hypothetical protein [Piscibacillus salipiscarius]|uniref:Uncharacterized protein n=1 Tax=Piscibacillus salipiscarius TaxID=299480 RepID=A0ABW5Q952_9BACI|nr:hypothetical protein [Piscibacillus salipiscarius]
MNNVKITFSNNEAITVYEGGILIPIKKVNNEGTSLSEPVELWSHTHDGLIPCLTELFSNSLFFFEADNKNKVYSVSAIVKLEVV